MKITTTLITVLYCTVLFFSYRSFSSDSEYESSVGSQDQFSPVPGHSPQCGKTLHLVLSGYALKNFRDVLQSKFLFNQPVQLDNKHQNSQYNSNYFNLESFWCVWVCVLALNRIIANLN